jgi:hypothetical protein
MKRSTRITAIVVGVGAAGLAGLIAVAPALAGAGPGWGGGPGVGAGQTVAAQPGGGGYGPGTGGGMGMGGGVNGGAGLRDGTCHALNPTVAKGTLTPAQKDTLADMAQEEKLAHDLYAAFADKYDAVIFDHIARSETQHLTAVRTLLDRYGLADPTADKAAGQFSDADWQARYDRLLAQGSASEKAALGVGVSVEEADIADLRQAQEGLSAPDVKQVYSRLLTASQHHLTAFDAWYTR